MAFDERQLDEIRGRLKVSAIVGARFPIMKKGTEYVVKDNESFTINDKKCFWVEFGAGGDGKPHDIFDFLQTYEGYTFVGAVEELAKQAGIALENRPGRSAGSSRGSQDAGQARNGRDRSDEAGSQGSRDDRPDPGLAKADGDQPRGKREVTATWDYLDPENALLYQVVRMQERMPDGEWKKNREGKVWKTFLQRRPSPDKDGLWVLGLDFVDRETGEPLEFLRTEKSQAWLRANDERLQWRGITTRKFLAGGNVEHWLYNANAVIDELQEPKEDQRTIFLPEGEGKVDILKEWGLLAVTNSGGAKNFTENCAEFFRGARHVVILQDNDRAGAERVARLAPMLKAVGVETVQRLNFFDVWPQCPFKGDIKDWRESGGTKDKLLEIVDELKEWSPEPYRSRFGAKTAVDLGAAVRAYPWRIKGIMPMNDNCLVMGPSRSGKTFEVLDMVMHVHNGEPFAGRKVVPGGFVYLTYEGATGFENRLRAYLKHHGMKAEDLHSFAWITRPPNLFATEDNAILLADEIKQLASTFRLPYAGTVVDTHNSATRGSSEIKSDDMNRIMANYDIVKDKTGAPLIVIGHTNAEGKHRGNEQFFNNIETAILVERAYTDAKHTNERRDDDGLAIRRGRISKQREDDDRTSWEFVLHKVKIGTDEDGEDITSMVSVEPRQHVPQEVLTEYQRERPEGFFLKGNNVDVFRTLLKAIDDIGQVPPPALGLPAAVAKVITWTQLGIEYQKTDPREQEEDLPKYRTRIKARVRRFRDDLLKYNVIGIAEAVDPKAPLDDIDKPRKIHYVWPTGRQVYGKGLQWPPVPKKKKEQAPILAPGESEIPPDVF